MKLIDDKGKLFGKFNLIDVCVIVIIIALALGAFYKFGMINDNDGKGSVSTQPISYVVKVEKVRKLSLNNVKVGDDLYDKVSGNAIGKITKIESEQSKDVVEMLDGTVKLGDVENRINLMLTVEAEGTITSKGTFINKTYELLVGSKKKFCTKYFDCEGSVSEIL